MNPVPFCIIVIIAVLSLPDRAAAQTANEDPYLWLEQVEGERALEWVESRNRESLARLQRDDRFADLESRALDDYNAQDKIPYGAVLGGTVHNFWQDTDNVRGLWRVTSLESYAAARDDWRVVLDLDRLAAEEQEDWVYKGRDCLAPQFNRCLIRLSRGGGDAVVIREFDVAQRRFVPLAAGGFHSPESKQWAAWVDADTLLIATDFGDRTMNDSGYPRQVRLWRRGTPLSQAPTLLNADPRVAFNIPFASHRPDGVLAGVQQGPDFFTQVIHLLRDQGGQPRLARLDLPLGIDMQGVFGDRIILLTRKEWRAGDHRIAAGSLVAVDVDDALAGTPERSLSLIQAPSAQGAIQGVSIGRDRLLVNTLHQVSSRLLEVRPVRGGWRSAPIDLPDPGSASVVSSDDWSDSVLVNFDSFLQPSTLYALGTGRNLQFIRDLPARFDADGLVTEQHFATSADGTRVPYFLIRHSKARANGATPTLLYGYGGFEVALTPGYLSGVDRLWLEQGGAYAVANIRGGGEFGPAWHQAALKENRQRAYDDFIAVAEHLIASGLTSPRHLGIRGGSNGGLLMGAMLTQRPDLFNAIICAVPLLDMLRYHKLLAGASWMAEYGNPDDPLERAFISRYSPYQNLDLAHDYPEVFFYTSTRDDRVHPGHARKMAARMQAMGKPILYYENTKGGHSAAADLRQRAFMDALQVAYALQKLSDR